MSRFTLILHDAKDPSEQGRQALKALLHTKLKLPVQSLDEMFQTLPVIIKQDLDENQANNYLNVFDKLGAMVELLPDQKELEVLEFEFGGDEEESSVAEPLLAEQAVEPILQSEPQIEEPPLQTEPEVNGQSMAFSLEEELANELATHEQNPGFETAEQEAPPLQEIPEQEISSQEVAATGGVITPRTAAATVTTAAAAPDTIAEPAQSDNLLNEERSASNVESFDDLTAELEAELGQLGFDDSLLGGAEVEVTETQTEPEPEQNIPQETATGIAEETPEKPAEDQMFDLSTLSFDDEEEPAADVAEVEEVAASPQAEKIPAPSLEAEQAVDTDDLMGELEAQLMAFDDSGDELDLSVAPPAEEQVQEDQLQTFVPQSEFPEVSNQAEAKVQAAEESLQTTSSHEQETPVDHLNDEPEKRTSAAFRRPAPQETLNDGQDIVEPRQIIKPAKGIGNRGLAAGLAAILLGGAGLYMLIPPAPQPRISIDQKSVKLLLDNQRNILAQSKKNKKLGLTYEEEAEIKRAIVLTGWKVDQTLGDDFHLQMILKADEDTGRVIEMETLVKQKPSAKLSKKEIVNNVQRKAWIRRFETSLKRPKRKPRDIEPKTIVAKGYAYLEDGKGTGRSDVKFTLRPEYDPETKTLKGTWQLKSHNAEHYDRGAVKRLGSDFELFFKGEFVAEKTTQAGTRKPPKKPEEKPKPVTLKAEDLSGSGDVEAGQTEE